MAPIPATPYPDDRYRTQLLWWNRRDFFNHAEPRQLTKILDETKQLLHEQYRRGRVEAAASKWIPTAHVNQIRSSDSEVA